MTQISVKELNELLNEGEDVFILDVREEYELNNGTIEGHTWIPQDQVPSRVQEIPKDKKVIVYCRSGNRSEGIRQFLIENGYTNVLNLRREFLVGKRLMILLFFIKIDRKL